MALSLKHAASSNLDTSREQHVPSKMYRSSRGSDPVTCAVFVKVNFCTVSQHSLYVNITYSSDSNLVRIEKARDGVTSFFICANL